jgi:hypothetical protein
MSTRARNTIRTASSTVTFRIIGHRLPSLTILILTTPIFFDWIATTVVGHTPALFFQTFSYRFEPVWTSESHVEPLILSGHDPPGLSRSAPEVLPSNPARCCSFCTGRNRPRAFPRLT